MQDEYVIFNLEFKNENNLAKLNIPFCLHILIKDYLLTMYTMCIYIFETQIKYIYT
jgi:hypothetical protein